MLCTALLPTLAFWGLDGYFLRQERLFRKLYDKVTATAPEQIDFSMNTQPFANDVDGWLKTCCSSTLLAFYGAVFGSAVLVFLHILISGV